MHLGVLYHWSPSTNRESIRAAGLVLGSPARDGLDWTLPYVCLATTPSSAWGLILDPGGVGSWDLWQVSVRDGDHLSIRGDFAPWVREVRVLHGLGPDRVWLVGSREA